MARAVGDDHAAHVPVRLLPGEFLKHGAVEDEFAVAQGNAVEIADHVDGGGIHQVRIVGVHQVGDGYDDFRILGEHAPAFRHQENRAPHLRRIRWRVPVRGVDPGPLGGIHARIPLHRAIGLQSVLENLIETHLRIHLVNGPARILGVHAEVGVLYSELQALAGNCQIGHVLGLGSIRIAVEDEEHLFGKGRYVGQEGDFTGGRVLAVLVGSVRIPGRDVVGLAGNLLLDTADRVHLHHAHLALWVCDAIAVHGQGHVDGLILAGETRVLARHHPHVVLPGRIPVPAVIRGRGLGADGRPARAVLLLDVELEDRGIAIRPVAAHDDGGQAAAAHDPELLILSLVVDPVVAAPPSIGAHLLHLPVPIRVDAESGGDVVAGMGRSGERVADPLDGILLLAHLRRSFQVYCLPMGCRWSIDLYLAETSRPSTSITTLMLARMLAGLRTKAR